LARYDPPAQYAELQAFRDEGYPFTASEFVLGTPPHVSIDPIEPPAPALGEPIELNVTVKGPGTLALQYALVDAAAGEIVASGNAEGGDGGAFTVAIGSDVTSALFPGLYQLYLAASSDEVAEVAEQRIDLEIGV